MSDPATNATYTYYEVLGIPPSATSDDIHVAFRRLAKLYHPDKNMNRKKDERDAAEAKYRDVDEAYRVLSDPAKRAQYDQKYNAGSASTSPFVAMVSPGQLISDLEAYFAKYLSVAPGVTLLLSLWTMHSYIFLAFKTASYLNVRSPLYGSGKSTIFELLAEVVARPYDATGGSLAVVYRRIADLSPTLLMDEAEFLRGRDNRAREFLRIFNMGYKRGGTVERMIGGMVESFDTFGPKAFSSIKGLSPGTPLFDRSITINMQPGDAVPFDREKEIIRTWELGLRLESYAVQNESDLLQIQDASDQSWPEIRRRDRELWGPLLFHARLAGPEIEARAYELAKQSCREKHQIQVEGDTKVALARELAYVLDKNGGKKNGKAIESNPAALVKLVQDEENWGAVLSGKGEHSQAMFMGGFLRDFRIRSRKLDGRTLWHQPDILAKLKVHLPKP
jgi:curved DNA-binding protein CbpA